MKLNVTISKTAMVSDDREAKQKYMQIMSDDMVSINIVLIADEIEVADHTKKEDKK